MTINEMLGPLIKKIHRGSNNKTFTYVYIYPALAMMSVLWISDRILSVTALFLFVVYSAIVTSSRSSIHASAKVFCATAVLFLILFEFLIISHGPVKVAIYSFTALAVLEILALKVVRSATRVQSTDSD